MISAAASVPDVRSTLCEQCGYVLDGLPTNGNCPECGKPIAESAAGLRRPSAFELSTPQQRLAAFLSTTLWVIFKPRDFFRHLSLKTHPRARRFALIHFCISSALIGWAFWLHAKWFFIIASTPYRLGI